MAPRLPPLPRVALVAVLGLTACAAPAADDSACTGAKCDTPGDSPEEACADRRDDASSSQQPFTRDAIRWACSDVAGVNTNGGDDRGQEYCEYFAIVQPPPVMAGGAPPSPVRVGRDKSRPLAVVLSDDQIVALEDAPDVVVGQCVFSSWHNDAAGAVTCDGAACPPVHGFALDQANLRMLGGLNSGGAAQMLVHDCLTGSPDAGGDAAFDDAAYRGCMKCGEMEGACLYWRRSDPAVCTAAMRLAECGCGLDTDGDGQADPVDVAAALVPTSGPGMKLGFPLGGWTAATALPAGCRYASDDGSQVVVTCDLTAADLLASQSDPKGRCRDKYGDNVVVHVPIPADLVVCEPPAGGPYAASCTATPWVP